jgi:hypothetical protein
MWWCEGWGSLLELGEICDTSAARVHAGMSAGPGGIGRSPGAGAPDTMAGPVKVIFLTHLPG